MCRAAAPAARGSETRAWHAMAEEHHRHGLRQLLARILSSKVDTSTLHVIIVDLQSYASKQASIREGEDSDARAEARPTATSYANGETGVTLAGNALGQLIGG